MKKFALTLNLLALTAVAASTAHATVLNLDASGQSVMANSRTRNNGFTSVENQKSGSGVSLAYRVEGTPSVGSPITIVIQMSSSSDAMVFLRAGEGLTLANPGQQLQSLAGAVAEHSITVVPNAQGRYYLSVFSVANGRPSAASIPVSVGHGLAQLKPSGTVQVTPSGERIISVPIQ
jgi:hypothetical protein